MELIDTHVHLASAPLADDCTAVLDRARQAGVTQFICIGATLAEADQALALAEREPSVFATAGIHPHEAATITAAGLDAIAAKWSHPRVVAIGEIGLDYHYDFADRGSQQRVFAAQLDQARSIDLPVIIHCREAFPDTIRLLEDHGFVDRPVVVHCYTGTAAEAVMVQQRGWRLSLTGIVTFKKSTQLQQIARDMPAAQLMLETDAPYLSPEPVRRVRPNEPAHVLHLARFLADLRGVNIADLAAETTASARVFFNLPTP